MKLDAWTVRTILAAKLCMKLSLNSTAYTACVRIARRHDLQYTESVGHKCRQHAKALCTPSGH